MKYGKTIILLILAIFLLSITCVCASEIDTSIASEDTGQMKLSANEMDEDNLKTVDDNATLAQADSDETVGVDNDLNLLREDTGTYSGLSEEIGSGRNITLKYKNYVYNGGSTITISTNNCVIDGNGAVIDMCQGHAQAFLVNAFGVTFKNLTIKNALFEGEGAAICFTQTGTVTNCNFTGNRGAGMGGAIFISSGTVENCTFTGNYAGAGGAVGFGGNGTVTNCNFTYNTARSMSAVLFMGNGAVTNCSLAKNTAGSFGAVGFGGNGTVTNCNFTDNKATDDESFGGAIYFNSGGTLTNCNFSDNNATTGSAIYFYSTSANKTVSNSIFLNNRADAEALEAIQNENNIILTFTGKDNLLNAIYSRGDVNFTNVDYWGENGIENTGRYAEPLSGYNRETGQKIIVEIYDSNKELVENVTFITNNDGQVRYDFIKLNNGNYTYKAYHSEDSYYTYINISGNFTLNSALGDFNRLQSYINGAGINSILTLCRDYTFTIGKDENLTGGIVIDKPLTINGNGHTINALGKARIFNVNSAYVVLNNITFTNGNANGGGAIYFYNYDDWGFTITNCNFTNNTATSGKGGAIYFTSSATVIKCIFTDNHALEDDGGAIYYNTGIGTVTDCNFVNNTAKAIMGGGTIFFNYYGNVTNCNFTGNKAIVSQVFGGVIWMDSGTVKYCNFVDNEATNGFGGAAYFNNGCTVENCNFTNNRANHMGGAVYVNFMCTVTNCSFTDNRAGEHGGAVCMYYCDDISDCNFINNVADLDGGAIYYIDGDATVTNCNFTGNNASSGSAIYFGWDTKTKTISNSTFLNNRANRNDLEVIQNENNITITFTGNDNLLNAIHSDGDVTFTNVNYWSANGIANTGSSAIKPSRSNREAGQNITVGVVVNDEIVFNGVKVTDENGMIVLNISVGENYFICARHDTDSYYTEAVMKISNMTFNVNVSSQTTNKLTVNITAKSNIYSEVMSGQLLFILPNGTEINATYASNGTWWAVHTFDNAGDYNVTASYIGLDNVTVNNATIAIRYDAIVNVNNRTLDLLIGDTFTLVATTTPEGLNVSYVPDDSGVYGVDENGTVTGLRDGDGSIWVKIVGEGIYTENFTIVNVTVSKVPTQISVLNDTLDLAVTEVIAAGATLTPGEAGNLTYSISNSSVVKVEDRNIIALAEGKAIITVSFEGDKKYLEAENKTINVSVHLNDARVTAEDMTLDVYSNATISPVTSPEGLEVEYVSGNISIAEVDANGIISAHNAGNATITITTKADGIHAVNSTTINILVNKIDSAVDVNDTVLDYGPAASVSVATDGAIGITAKINGEEIIFSGNAIPIPVLNVGTYNLTVTTIPDGNHIAVNKTVKVTVNPASSALDVNGTDIFFGNDAVLNYTAVNATGINVSIADWRGNALKDGVDYNISITDSQIIIRFFDDGTYTVNVTTLTDANHIPTLRNVTVHVNPICDLEVILTPMNLTANYGDTVTWNATIISHGPSYPFMVNLYAYAQEGLIFKNAYSDSNYYHSSIPFTLYPNIPLYVFLKTLVNASNVNLTINVTVKDDYFPDPNPDNNNASATVEIIYVTADLNITAPSQITVGDSASVEVALPEDATGNITVKADGYEQTTVFLTNGTANITLTGLSAGNHTVEIIYSGDEKYSPANETHKITVSKQNATADVTVSLDITVGEDSNVNVKLPGDATGNVTVKVDGETVNTVPVTNGTANVILSSLKAGNHTVEITYSGDDRYNPVSETMEISVSKKDADPEIAVDDETVNVKLPGDATGNVTVKVDGETVSTVPATDGTASVKLPKLSVGNHTVEIAYSGDAGYNPSTKTVVVSADKDTTNLAAENVTATYKVKKYLTITLTDSKGSPIANATVTVKLKSAKDYITDGNGQIKVKVSNLVPKTYTAQITFKGDERYTGSDATSQVVVKKAASRIKAKAKTFKTTAKTKRFKIILKDKSGKAIKNAKVTLKVKGKIYNATTNLKGKATFKITKLSKKGTYKAVIKYKGNKYYKKTSKKAKITVKPAWKTVSKGSKLKNTVKKIQRALKANRYYLSYNGHYLKVDGIYEIYTEWAVKLFQQGRGLKVTGKVDYSTARELKLVK